MKGWKMTFFLILMISFIGAGTGCGKREEAKEIQTVASSPLPHEGFKAKISIDKPLTSMRVNSSTPRKVKVKNISSTLWPSKETPNGQYSIHLSYHWLDKEEKVVVFDGLRTSFPYDMSPGREIIVDALVAAPNRTGEYILEWDMVQEGVSWFKDKGGETLKIHMIIE